MNYPKNHWLYFFFVTLILTILFNFNLVKDVAFSNRSTIPINDGVVTEFITEAEYQNVIQGRNPFVPTKQILYPFTTDIFNQDPSTTHIIPLFFLRPFFDVHRITITIVLFNIILANLFMYILLRKMDIGWQPAVIASLVFGFSPFLSYRVLGHYTYTVHYFFPLLMLLFIYYFEEKEYRRKLLLSVLWGVSWAFLFYANPYYFIMAVIAVFFFFFYFLVHERKSIVHFFMAHMRNLTISCAVFLVLLSPWLAAYKNYSAIQAPQTSPSIIRSLILSADVLSFVMPSEFNPLYNAIFDRFSGINPYLNNLSRFFEYNWKSFAYPGIIVLWGYFMFFVRYKKASKKTRKAVMPFVLAGLFFALLSLGPLFKIVNRWSITLPEDIPLYFPLPFLMFHFLPFLKDLTAPARFITGFAFFGSILSAFVLQGFFKRLKKTQVTTTFIIIFFIFLLDQMYVVPNRPEKQIPLKAYTYLAKSDEPGTVLEVPFTVRDGLQYIGDVHATPIMRGSIIHNRQIIGGYLSRVDTSIFDYYKGLPFIGHTAAIIDKGNFHLYKEQPQEPNVSPFTVSTEALEDEIDFLDITYILLKQREDYTQLMLQTLTNIGFSKILDDTGYTLYYRPPRKKEFTAVIFGEGNDYLFAGENFGPPEKDFRWAMGKSATVFVKITDPKKTSLSFEIASFHRSQIIDIYVNNNFIGQEKISASRSSYHRTVSKSLKAGINSIQFKFSQSFQPKDILSKSDDQRELAVKFYSLSLNK